MSDKNNSLERWVTEQLLPVDKKARPTRGSGCGNEIGDNSNKYLYIECKQKLTKSNVIMERSVWFKHLNGLPIATKKIPIYVTENKEREKYVVMSAHDFFNIIKKLKLQGDL